MISREDTISVSSKLQYSERCSVACSRGRRLQTPELWFGLCNQLPKRGARGRVYGVPPTKPDNGVRLFRARPTRRQRPVTPQQPAHAGMVRRTVTGGTPDEAQPAQDKPLVPYPSPERIKTLNSCLPNAKTKKKSNGWAEFSCYLAHANKPKMQLRTSNRYPEYCARPLL